MFDCIHNPFTLSQEISTLHLSKKEEEELLGSFNIISSVIHFWMVIKWSYIFYHVLSEQKFPAHSDFQEFQELVIKKPPSRIVYGHFTRKAWY